MVGASEEKEQILIREPLMDFVDLCHVSRLCYSLLAWSLNCGNCVLIFELFLPAALSPVLAGGLFDCRTCRPRASPGGLSHWTRSHFTHQEVCLRINSQFPTSEFPKFSPS